MTLILVILGLWLALSAGILLAVIMIAWLLGIKRRRPIKTPHE